MEAINSKFIKNDGKRKIILGLSSFFIPIILLSIIYFMLNITPFGERTLLTIDLNGQYISYFSYLKNAILGNDNLLYSFSKTMSGNMVGLVGYYLLSPFNILFLFSETAGFPLIVTIITMLKTGTAGLTMYTYLKNHRSSNILTVSLTTAYAMSSYMIAYQQNIMWLDGVILLPLIILGIDKMIKNKNNYIYPLFLSIAVITNYYIGFMLCIFSVIYFISALIQKSLDKNLNYKNNIKLIAKFIALSLIAGGISSITWMPSLLSYSGSSKVEFDWSTIFTTGTNFSLIEFISKFITGTYNRQQMIEGLPNIFIPTTLVLISIPFLINKFIKKSIKVKYTILLLTMYFSFNFIGLNRVWHGFANPTWFPYRYSFIFVFILICMVSLQLENKKENKSYAPLVITVFITTILVIYMNDFSYISTEQMLFTFSIGLITVLAFYLIKTKNVSSKVIVGLLVLLTFVDSTINGYLMLDDYWYKNEEVFNDFVSETEPIMNEYAPDTNEFYRLDKTFEHASNDPLLLNYPGLSHYSSNEINAVNDFLSNLGYRSNGNWLRYADGSSLFSDSFMGIKYRISDNERNYLETVESINLELNESMNVKVQENPYAFPLGFSVQNISSFGEDYNNTFEYQNSLIVSLFNMESFYEPVPLKNIEIETENLVRNEESNSYKYVKDNPNQEAYINFSIDGLNNMNQLNVFFKSGTLNDNSGELYFDGELSGEILNLYSNNIHSTNIENGQLEVTLKVVNEELQFTEPLFYTNNMNDFQEIYNTVSENGIDIIEFEGDHILGELPESNENNMLLFTMPYDEGWEVLIDGQVVETNLINDVLLGIELPDNGEIIEMKYTPRGLNSSIVLFIASSIFLGLIIIFDKNKYNKILKIKK